MFTPHEFARWVGNREGQGSALIAAMPQPSAHAPDHYFSEVLKLLERDGVVRTHEFYCDLLAIRPRRAAELTAVATYYGQDRAARLARELARHGEARLIQPMLLRNRGAWSQATGIYRLDELLTRAARLAPGDARKAHVDRMIAKLSDEILVGPAPGISQPMSVTGSTIRTPVPTGPSLGLLIKTTLLTVLIGGTVLLAIHDLAQRFFGADADGEQRRPPPLSIESDSRTPPVSPVPQEEPKLETDAPTSKPEAQTKSGGRGSRGHRSVIRGASTVPDPFKPTIPALPKNLGILTVADNVAEVFDPWSYRNLSLRLRVLPEGKVDRDSVSVSTVYSRVAISTASVTDPVPLAERLAGLRFPPSIAGSGMLLCYVVDGDTPQFTCKPD